MIVFPFIIQEQLISSSFCKNLGWSILIHLFAKFIIGDILADTVILANASIFTTLEKQSTINRLSNPVNRNRSAAKISKVMSSNHYSQKSLGLIRNVTRKFFNKMSLKS